MHPGKAQIILGIRTILPEELSGAVVSTEKSSLGACHFVGFVMQQLIYLSIHFTRGEQNGLNADPDLTHNIFNPGSYNTNSTILGCVCHYQKGQFFCPSQIYLI